MLTYIKRRISLLLVLAISAAGLNGCGQTQTTEPDTAVSSQKWEDAVTIQLSDDGVSVDGETASTDETAAVYTANDIVYYEEGKDFTYGEGTEADAHSTEKATAHTVVHITQSALMYCRVRSPWVRLPWIWGEDAEEDSDAVVTLVLNGVDNTCEVAPAVIFYNVYECGSADAETASETVDTSAAGETVIIADGSTNTVNGSYVARIYKPDSVELSEDGTGVLHLTINGGNINITSGNDGTNTNEAGVSVTTINGGTVMATVHMLDRIEDGGQNYVVFNFAQRQNGADRYLSLKNNAGEEILGHLPVNDYTIYLYSSPELTAGEYTLWSCAPSGGDAIQLLHSGMGGGRPCGFGGQADGEASEVFTIVDGGNMFSGVAAMS